MAESATELPWRLCELAAQLNISVERLTYALRRDRVSVPEVSSADAPRIARAVPFSPEEIYLAFRSPPT